MYSSLSIKVSSYKYRNFHYKDKTVWRPSYLYNENFHTGKDGIYIETVPYKTWSVFWKTPPLQWRHNERDGVSNHQSHDCLLNRLFRRRSKKASKLCVTASNVENVSIWWRYHAVPDGLHGRQCFFQPCCFKDGGGNYWTDRQVFCMILQTWAH